MSNINVILIIWWMLIQDWICRSWKNITIGALYPDGKVHGANMGPTWALSAPDGPHVGLMNLAIRVVPPTLRTHGHMISQKAGWMAGTDKSCDFWQTDFLPSAYLFHNIVSIWKIITSPHSLRTKFLLKTSNTCNLIEYRYQGSTSTWLSFSRCRNYPF